MEENKNKSVEDDKVEATNKKEEVKPIPSEYGTSFVCALLGGIMSLVFLNTTSDRLLFHLSLENGINPILLVIVMILFFLLSSVYFFRLAKENQKLYLPLAFLMLTCGLVNTGFYIYREFDGDIIDVGGLSLPEDKQFNIITSKHEGYMYITTLTGYCVDDEKRTNEFHLFVKLIEGRRFYYCSGPRSCRKLFVKKDGENTGKVFYWNKFYIINFDFDWDNQYVPYQTFYR